MIDPQRRKPRSQIDSRHCVALPLFDDSKKHGRLVTHQADATTLLGGVGSAGVIEKKAMAKFRSMVSDAVPAATFYTENLGFSIELQVPAICIVSRGDPKLLLSGPKSSARRPHWRALRVSAWG